MSKYTAYLAELVERNTSVIHLHVDDLSQEETLVQPPGGNNMNWVLGHLVAHREHIFTWIGADLPWEAGKYLRFDRDSTPLLDPAEGVSLEKVLRDLDTSKQLLVAWLNQVDEVTLGNVLEGKRRNLGGMIDFYLWHEAYHVGQFELLRHVAGRHESLI